MVKYEKTIQTFSSVASPRFKTFRSYGIKKASVESEQIYLIFNFDPRILKHLDKNDQRVSFIWDSLESMRQQLGEEKLLICYGDPVEQIDQYAQKQNIECVYASEDYESSAIERDRKVWKKLSKRDVKFETLKNSVIFHKDDILKNDGTAYKVFTPYKRAWLAKLNETDFRDYKAKLEQIVSWPKKSIKDSVNSLSDFSFEYCEPSLKGGESEAAKLFKEFSKKIKNYKNDRDYPIIEGTSNLSPYIRFGNISIRKLVKASYISKGEGAETWLSELIWREFYKMILYKFPHVETEAFRKEYSNIKWPGKKPTLRSGKKG